MRNKCHILIFWFAPFCYGCAHKESKTTSVLVSDFGNFDRKKYNLEIFPDTNLNWYILRDREVKSYLKEKEFVLDTNNDNHLFLIDIETQKKYWPENFPLIAKVVDTIIASGIEYQIAGQERLPGYPIRLTRIYMKCLYKNIK